MENAVIDVKEVVIRKLQL